MLSTTNSDILLDNLKSSCQATQFICQQNCRREEEPISKNFCFTDTDNRNEGEKFWLDIMRWRELAFIVVGRRQVHTLSQKNWDQIQLQAFFSGKILEQSMSNFHNLQQSLWIWALYVLFAIFLGFSSHSNYVLVTHTNFLFPDSPHPIFSSPLIIIHEKKTSQDVRQKQQSNL